MPKILAVDDSVTMRRVLELTFAGLDGFEVLSFESGDAAVQHAEQSGADLLIADASMSPDGYEVCRKLKAGAQTGGIPVLILGSQHTPIDADKAKAAGADDTALKPYDTNAFIEKVKQAIAKGGAKPAAAPAAAQVATYRTAPAAAPGATAAASPAPAAAAKRPMLELAEDDEPEITVGTVPGTAPAPAPAPAPAAPAPVPGIIGKPAAAAPAAPARPAASPATRSTIGFGSAAVPPAKPAAPAVSSAAARPAAAAPTPAAPAAPAPAAAAAPAAAVAAVAPKLEGMGLTPEQVQGVLALTREVIERVVWEVVPDLAETIIREEIKRLTK